MNKIKRAAVVLLTLIFVLGAVACSKQEQPAAAEAAPAPVKKDSVEAFGVVKAVDEKKCEYRLCGSCRNGFGK